MKRSTFILTLVAAAATMLTGCDNDPVYPPRFHPGNTEESGETGQPEEPEIPKVEIVPLNEISGTIEEVATRVANPAPGDSPRQFYRLSFDELEPGDYAMVMRVERMVGDELVTFDVARTAIAGDGSFKLTMPATIDPAWLEKAPVRLERLWEEGGHRPIALDGLPAEVEISNPEVDMCLACLYMERTQDGQRYYIYFGGPDKESYHVTDLSSVMNSSLLYTSDKVNVKGWTDGRWEYFRGFDVESTGGWNWLHCIGNGLSEYVGWETAWPEWAVMGFSARAIYEE